MTREEAIKTLKEHKIMFQHDFGWDISTIKALDIAISALSTDGEYIKKEELFEKIQESGSQFFDYSEVVELADSVPTYSFPEREKGEWIPAPFDFELFQAGLMDMPKGMTNRDVIQALFPNATFKDAFIDTFTEITFVGSGYALLKKEWLESGI